MSKYTTEVRYICESLAGYDESQGGANVDTIVNTAAPKIFESFPIYDESYRATLMNKILRHYYYREISIIPPGEWKNEFLRTMFEIMPKYIIMYKYLDESPELFGASSEYYKSRNIYSDFPQTLLNGTNADYASSGNDMEFERLRQMDILDLAERLRSYDDVDLLIIDEIESMFSCLLTVNVNAF